ncbi:MAG: hypothetical protein QM613_05660 [Micrococcaceae bacterium]
MKNRELENKTDYGIRAFAYLIVGAGFWGLAGYLIGSAVSMPWLGIVGGILGLGLGIYLVVKMGNNQDKMF